MKKTIAQSNFQKYIYNERKDLWNLIGKNKISLIKIEALITI